MSIRSAFAVIALYIGACMAEVAFRLLLSNLQSTDRHEFDPKEESEELAKGKCHLLYAILNKSTVNSDSTIDLPRH